MYYAAHRAFCTVVYNTGAERNYRRAPKPKGKNMKKIISLFQRNYEGDRLVRNELVPGSEWVANGEGVATRKFDGTCCKVESGKLYKRYDSKQGKQPPVGFIPAQDPDPVTGHWPGWIEVSEKPEDRWFVESQDSSLPDGTYELCGPKVQSNPEGFTKHVLIPHGKEILDAPRTFDELKVWFVGKNIEGIVWHRENGDMVKIKAKDFGIKRGARDKGNAPVQQTTAAVMQ